MSLPLKQQLDQLESARQIVLGDSALYPQIVQGILPIIGANARPELRRWGAEFLAETFASPVFAPAFKERTAVGVLDTLKNLLEIPGEDAAMVKGIVEAAASIYGLVFHYIIQNPIDVPVWNQMTAIKSNILKRWDTGSTGVRICCVKFVQKIVQVQTPGIIADPRRPEQNEISLATVPRDHPQIPPSKLEPEASGLLDRLLSVFQEEHSDAVLVNATLNCLAILLRTRQSIANKILSAILNFNPLRQANSPMGAKEKVQIKSMERTARALLLNVYRRNENGPFAARIKAYVDKMTSIRMDVFDEGSRKRAYPTEPTDGLNDTKRRRLGAEVPNKGIANIAPMPRGPASVKQLFTLTQDQDLANFDTRMLPLDLMMSITLPVLARVDQQALNEALNHVRSRLLSLEKLDPNLPQFGALGDDEEDYEPDFEPSEDREQIINKADALPPEDTLYPPGEVAIGPFTLPSPPPLTADLIEEIGKGTINRVFEMMGRLDEPAAAKKQRIGLNRLAGSTYDREAWITVVTRLATRASSGLVDDSNDYADSKAVTTKNTGSSISDSIRQELWRYIMQDFRARLGVGIAWLNEEWYNDRLQMPTAEHCEGNEAVSKTIQHYERWMLKLLDGFIPYLDAKDSKYLIRFLSEIPEVNEEVLKRVKGLAKDPERVQLAVTALLYLVMMKLPARCIALDALEDLWRNHDDAKAFAAKPLAKWRPDVLASETKPSTGQNFTGEKQQGDAGPPPPSSTNALKTEGEQMEKFQGSRPVIAAG